MNTKSISRLNFVGQLSDRTYAVIKNAIIDGILVPGEDLIENDLAEKIGVSKTPIREALLRLEVEGLVARSPNKGAYVKGLSVDELSEIYVVKRELEALAVRLATPKLTPDDTTKAVKIIQTEKELWRKGNVTCEDLDNSISFHDWLINRAGNQILAGLLKRLNVQALRTRMTLVHFPGWLDTSATDHKSILDNMAIGNSGKAEELILLHNDRIINTLKEHLKEKDAESVF